LAAVLAATASFVLAVGHLLTTPTLDVLITVLVVMLLVRIVRTGEHRWWLLIGLATGVGLENKSTIAPVLLALAVGAVCTRSWRAMTSRWTVAAGAIAVVLWLPNLWWQARHGWTLVSFSRAIARYPGGENRAQLVPFQLLVLGPPLAPVLIAGIVSVWRRPAWRRLRFLPIGYVALLVVLAVSGGKGYYAAGLVLPFAATGSIMTVEWMGLRRRALRRVLVVTAIVANTAVGAVVTLPLLPQRLVGGAIVDLNHDAAETIGWPAFVDQVAVAVSALPPSERSTAVILTVNYGEAGAIDRFGPARGIGPAYSGHNSYTTFRTPPDTQGPVVAIGFDDLSNDPVLGRCAIIATIATPDEIDNDENGARIWRCNAPSQGWASVWGSLAHEG
jgi:4-amino-4-deoxy-L-arabinose transferase-like glycosyltransferase